MPSSSALDPLTPFPNLPPPTVLRRLAVWVYDCILVVALLLLTMAVMMGVIHLLGGPRDLYQSGTPIGWRLLAQFPLFLVWWGYFCYAWVKAGQTLAQKTWGIRVVYHTGAPLTWWQASVRFFLAIPAWGALAVTLAWILVDRDAQFLHDRLAGTRVVRV